MVLRAIFKFSRELIEFINYTNLYTNISPPPLSSSFDISDRHLIYNANDVFF